MTYLRMIDFGLSFIIAVAIGLIVSGLFAFFAGTGLLNYFIILSTACFCGLIGQILLDCCLNKISSSRYDDFYSARGCVIGKIFNDKFYALCAEFDCNVGLDFESENIIILQLLNKNKSRGIKSAFMFLEIKYHGFIIKIAIQSERNYNNIRKEREAILAYFQKCAETDRQFSCKPLGFKEV